MLLKRVNRIEIFMNIEVSRIEKSAISRYLNKTVKVVFQLIHNYLHYLNVITCINEILFSLHSLSLVLLCRQNLLELVGETQKEKEKENLSGQSFNLLAGKFVCINYVI